MLFQALFTEVDVTVSANLLLTFQFKWLINIDGRHAFPVGRVRNNCAEMLALLIYLLFINMLFCHLMFFEIIYCNVIIFVD